MRLKPEVQPVVHAARKVPVAITEKVKAELDRMEKLNVISKVDEPTKWVNSMVVVPKPNGAVRICLYPRNLNKAINRVIIPCSHINPNPSPNPNPNPNQHFICHVLTLMD